MKSAIATYPTIESLKQIAPKWAQRVEKLPAPLFSKENLHWGADIFFVETCIVGEAHGYSDSYLKTCRKCTCFSEEFQTSFLLRNWKSFSTNLELFVGHWRENHNYKSTKESLQVNL